MNNNYRIIDQTGGGATHDIYAESLEEAIEAGREWIEDGEWSSEDGTYRTIELKCCVQEIVRGEDGEIDDDATAEGQSWDCSGTYSDELPECEAEANDNAADEQGHVWCPFSLVGGIRDNPGVWSNGGTRYTTKQVCRCCGMYRTEVDPGCQRNPDEALCTITLEPRDEDSEAWLKETHEEDGWIPEWLAAFLDCAPTVRMTEEQAKKWVEDQATHDEEPDADELEHAFAAIFGRRADDTDRTDGLLSLMAE